MERNFMNECEKWLNVAKKYLYNYYEECAKREAEKVDNLKSEAEYLQKLHEAASNHRDDVKESEPKTSFRVKLSVPFGDESGTKIKNRIQEMLKCYMDMKNNRYPECDDFVVEIMDSEDDSEEPEVLRFEWNNETCSLEADVNGTTIFCKYDSEGNIVFGTEDHNSCDESGVCDDEVEAEDEFEDEVEAEDAAGSYVPVNVNTLQKALTKYYQGDDTPDLSFHVKDFKEYIFDCFSGKNGNLWMSDVLPLNDVTVDSEELLREFAVPFFGMLATMNGDDETPSKDVVECCAKTCEKELNGLCDELKSRFGFTNVSWDWLCNEENTDDDIFFTFEF